MSHTHMSCVCYVCDSLTIWGMSHLTLIIHMRVYIIFMYVYVTVITVSKYDGNALYLPIHAYVWLHFHRLMHMWVCIIFRDVRIRVLWRRLTHVCNVTHANVYTYESLHSCICVLWLWLTHIRDVTRFSLHLAGQTSHTWVRIIFMHMCVMTIAHLWYEKWVTSYLQHICESAAYSCICVLCLWVTYDMRNGSHHASLMTWEISHLTLMTHFWYENPSHLWLTFEMRKYITYNMRNKSPHTYDSLLIWEMSHLTLVIHMRVCIIFIHVCVMTMTPSYLGCDSFLSSPDKRGVAKHARWLSHVYE